MNWTLMMQNMLLILLLCASLVAIEMHDLMHAVILLAGASIALAIVFYMLQAPDIALTEAVVNAGAIPALYIIVIRKTERYEK